MPGLLRSGAAVAVLVIAWGLTPGLFADDVEELEATLEEQVDAEDWKKARSTAKKLSGKVKDAERGRIEGILETIESELAWQKLAKRLDKAKKNPRKQLALAEKFLGKHEDNELLRTRAEAAREKARNHLYYLIEDFENPEDLDRDLLPETNRVKHGKTAARFKFPRRREMSILIETEEKDWSRFTALVLWIYSEKKSGRLTIDVLGEGHGNYFEAYNNIDWVGWKEIRIPLEGKGSRFARHGHPEWYEVHRLRLWKDDSAELDIVIDDIRLER